MLDPKAPNKVKLDVALLDAMDEHERIKKHRDLLMEQMRLKKEVARRQEATIQRLAADRARLRKKVEELEELCRAARNIPTNNAFIEWPRYEPSGMLSPYVNAKDKVTWNGIKAVIWELSWSFDKGWRAKIFTPDNAMCWVPVEKLSPGWKDDAGEIIQRRCIPASAS